MNDHAAINLDVQTLLEERHALKQQGGTLPPGRGHWIGQFQGKRRGHGSEYDDLRHYSTGDDARHIDWKASARTGVLHTRLYREEKDIRTTVVADLRDAMFTGSIELQAVRVCKVAARLLWQATQGGSRANVLVVTDGGISLSEPGSAHQAAIDACALLARQFTSNQTRLNAAAGTDTDTASSSAHPSTDPIMEFCIDTGINGYRALNLDTVSQWLIEHPGKLSTLLWISDFQHCGAHFDRNIAMLSETSDNVAIVVEDPLLKSGLPGGHYGYTSHNQTNTVAHDNAVPENRSVSLGYRASEQLRAALVMAATQRQARFEQLMVPMLSIEDGIDSIVTTLRHEQFLP